VLRFLAGAAACFLLLTGAFFVWQSRAEMAPGLPAAPAARSASLLGEPLEAPEATAKTREEKRFARYDKDKNGKVEAMEYLAARRRNFDKLDVDHNGALSFPEYAAKGIEKFNAAGGAKGLSDAGRIRSDRAASSKAQAGMQLSKGAGGG